MVFQAYDSDSEETMELGIEELVDENLVSLNLKKIVINLLYAKYQTSNGKQRVQTIYSYIKLNISKNIKLEEFFTIGPEELVGIGVFWEEWIAFLKCEDGDLAGKLLFEACMLQECIEMLCDTAREMVQKQPILYLKACKKDKTYLGCSNNIKGIFVPLFILYLDQSHSLSKAGEKLIEGLKYRLNYSNDDEKTFVERFLTWMDKIKITSEQYEKYITWLQSEVDKRTDAVVGGGFRGSYYKAAALIFTLGETMESQGNVGAKINIIENYKKIHSKKRAFKAEFEVLK